MNFIQYIIQFLLRDYSPELSSKIGYTSNTKEYSQYKLVIYPSGFFDEGIYGTKKSLPTLPLALWNDIPLLFGTPEVEIKGDTIILYADIIASTYFLISRYEEMVRRDVRDKHGRFPGKESLPCQASFIHRPIVEEYSWALRKLLADNEVDIQSEKQGLSYIYLTHDVDSLTQYRHIRGFLGAIKRLFRGKYELRNALDSVFGSLKNDPFYTFPFLFSCNNLVSDKFKNTESIAFIKVGGKRKKEDRPKLKVEGKDFQQFFQLAEKYNVLIGLHSSYEAGIYSDLIKPERQRLEDACGKRVNLNRHHFLSSRELEDMQELINARITDDFTMGYADISGFRLGTCRAVRWINPENMEVTDLVVHPLTVMDVSLSSPNYMNLGIEDAFNYSVQLIENCIQYGGEISLLWHNNSVANDVGYHRELYKRIINYLVMNIEE